jgi:hypothetical protein
MRWSQRKCGTADSKSGCGGERKVCVAYRCYSGQAYEVASTRNIYWQHFEASRNHYCPRPGNKITTTGIRRAQDARAQLEDEQLYFWWSEDIIVNRRARVHTVFPT